MAERQGQTAARNMLEPSAKFERAVPFFWSQHYDVPDQLSVGHAAEACRTRSRSTATSPAGRDCACLRYKESKETRACGRLDLHRDLDSLKAEFEMERATG